nr:hypothetical protein [Nostoc sp. ChiSLP01]
MWGERRERFFHLPPTPPTPPTLPVCPIPPELRYSNCSNSLKDLECPKYWNNRFKLTLQPR